MRGVQQRGRDVEPPEGELDIGVRLPDFADGPVAGRGDLILGGAPLRFGDLDPAPTRSAVEDFPFEEQSDPVAGLGRAEPAGGFSVGGDPRAAEGRADITDQ